ncbi:hypothetical protein [Paenibacillus radicis (ex Xue et al. 2023)]|uniref:Uncharacterized protein n=1 Tax=Paenibacillus radicis (ex Xue et al. 2023) TaxID=2972489 RepID=A0ABT1YK75_9BACL|nr:hypothetical protein [Paenibacillus radicis (ex Xue et al. 2023)]MCR8632789.1 hypothetical protein [Paenibacillus radicis (ex Xue et al. 2023)]
MFVMVTGLVLAVSVLAAALELPKLIKQRQGREAAVYGVMLVIGMALCIITGINIKLPSPFQLLVWVYKPVNDWFAAMFPGGG